MTGKLAKSDPVVGGEAPQPRPGLVHISQLTPDPKNARKRTERSYGMLHRSLSDFGAGRSILVDENGLIIAGNGTVEAAASVGIERVLVVPVDGNTLVAVQRTDLDATSKTALAIADNRSSDTSEFDAAVLAQLLEEDQNLDISPWFTKDEIRALGGETLPPEEPPPSSGKGMEIILRFQEQEAFDRFGSLLVQLAAALPEPEDLTERLSLVIQAYLQQKPSRGRPSKNL